MAVHRKRARPPRAGRGNLSRVTSLGALSAGGGDLGAAARIIADRARELAASWSVQIPPSISLEVSGRVATISSAAGPAYPGEMRARHPLFGNREFWYGPPGAPFLAPAADEASDAAMRRYAEKIDGWAREAGYR